MRADFNKWWLLPSGILITSALFALGIVVFQPTFVDRSFGPAPQVAQCSGASAEDYGCYQERYQNLVLGSGVDAAFDELKSEYESNNFVQVQCHQMTHVIGRAAVDLLTNMSSAYGQGDNFCWSGYYHGVMEAIVANIGADAVLEQAPDICSEFSQDQEQSFFHYNCVHGLGHGFMGILQNELFDSLDVCDTLGSSWEQNSCYSGVFMENVMAQSNPNNTSKYLKADQPLYPCTDVEDSYKEECYKMQTSYALQVQGGDFGQVFDLCGDVEGEFVPTCYQSLGRDASGRSVSDVDQTRSTCALGEDYEARSNCVIGAVKDFISYYSDDAQAEELCSTLDEADLRDVCLQTSEEYYEIFEA